jgi:hypothetical protein
MLAGAALAVAVASPASAAQLVSNGGFETGTFSDWTTTQPSAPLMPWTAATASTSGTFSLAAPPEGTYDALNGFDGNGPAHYTLSQTISIPATTATLAWKDRLQYIVFSSAEPRLLEVKVLNASTDATLATVYSYTTDVGARVDTGWQDHSADLSAFAGQTVKLVFDETIPQTFTGPGQIELDAISVSTPPLPTTKEQCKRGGWQTYGTTFKNQGDCVSFVATHGANAPTG